MRVKNKNYDHKDMALITEVKTYLEGRAMDAYVPFSDVEKLATAAGKTQGEVHQAIIDAGYEVVS